MTYRNLDTLSQEHKECLLLADRLTDIANRGNESELAAAVQWIREYNTNELEPHFQHEEQTILGPLLQEHHEYRPLCIQLGKEHGFLRTLAESISTVSAKQDLTDFAQVLRNHTLLEEEQLFPLLNLLTPTQRESIGHFAPLGKKPVPDNQATPPRREQPSTDTWLEAVDMHFQSADTNGHIVLFPRYQPELTEQLAAHLGLAFFDYQQAVMADLREQADTLTLAELEQTLREQSQVRGVVCHNAEALLCVKPEAERRAWLQHFISTDWPQPVIIPLSVFQADAPEDSLQVCDLELSKLPRQTTSPASSAQRLPYNV